MSRIIGDLEDLLAAVEHAARGEAQAIARQAEEEAARIAREAEDRAGREHRRILAEAEARAREIRQTRTRRQERDDRRAWLEAREDLLTEVWRQARERLDALAADESAHLEVLGRLVVEGARTLGPGEYAVAGAGEAHDLVTPKRCKAWAKQASEAVGGDVSLEPADAAADGAGGLVLLAGPRRWVDLTFAARLRDARDELREAVVSRLLDS